MTPNHAANVDVCFDIKVIKNGTFIYKKWICFFFVIPTYGVMNHDIYFQKEPK